MIINLIAPSVMIHKAIAGRQINTQRPFFIAAIQITAWSDHGHKSLLMAGLVRISIVIF
jgi:hypothetical protein